MSANYSVIYSFGDSLSDAGDAYLLTSSQLGQAFGLKTQPVSPPYYREQYGTTAADVFSDGPVWVQDLATALGLAAPAPGQVGATGAQLAAAGVPAQDVDFLDGGDPSNYVAFSPGAAGGTDFAIGGSVTGPTASNTGAQATLTDLQSQIDSFRNEYSAPSANALYTVWSGSNDVLNLLESSSFQTQSMAASESDVAASAQNEVNAVISLVQGGAQTVLIGNVPNLGLTPEITSKGPAAEQAATDLSNYFNSKLQTDLANASTQLSGAKVTVLDVYGLLSGTTSGTFVPGANGGTITDITDPAYTGSYTSDDGTVAADADSHLYFDQLHPTRTGHQAIANLAYAALVPPAAPTITAPADGTDTNDAKPTVSGTGENGDTVSLTLSSSDGTSVTLGTTVADGTWSIAPQSALPDGSYTATATQTNAFENTSGASNTETFTIDTTPPTITAVSDSGPGIDAQGNGDLGAGQTVTFTATTSEPVTVSSRTGNGPLVASLTDGGTATYDPARSTPTSVAFTYTVAEGENTKALAVTGVKGNGLVVTDAAGNPVDLSSLATAAKPAGTLVVDTTPPVVSSPTATAAQDGGPAPIGIAAPTDNLTPADSLAIAAGTLPTDGTVTLADGTPVASGQALTGAQLTGLLFAPTAAAGARSAFTYTVTDGAGNASQGTATLNVGAAAANPPAAMPPAASPPADMPTSPAATAPDAVSFSPRVTYRDGLFTLSGTASSAAGVASVEISATVGGQVRDLGAATVDASGNFMFQDAATRRVQGFITATATDGAGATASAQADYSLTGGLSVGPYTARETSYTADGSAVTSRTLFRDTGQRAVAVDLPGQTFASDVEDRWNDMGQPETTFAFTPGYGRDAISLFRVDGTDHDTLSFKGSDFGSDPSGQLAAALASTADRPGGAVITDPTTKETVQLFGISRTQLQANPGDFAFHA